ncbi:lectin like domain-containing protein [Clostridium sp.]|jgi:C1A family cysteine protease|uniref:lectin like domain-containing protein n=1 Tax=Clostridium sp. TaxID=1506 RepID=UPI003EEC11A4
MEKIKRDKIVSMIVVIMLIVTFTPAIIFAEKLSSTLAPVNPEFIEYMQQNQKLGTKGEERVNGLIPEPFIIQRSSSDKLGQDYVKSYPAKFDLRDYERVSSTKDQGQDGSCWAFAAYGAMESYLMTEKEWDFSENNMKNNHGFDIISGGSRSMSAAYLARLDGPVLETDDPYKVGDYNSPSNLLIQKYLTNVFYIPDRIDSLDNNLIKNSLMKYGAVQTSMYTDASYYNADSSYYYNGASSSTNHSVVIVGWDDTYSKQKFKNTPSQDGAFIVKNSWGKNWGQEGYFYISYNDKFVGKNNSVYIVEDTNKFDNIYQYDPLGMDSYSGYRGTNTAWFANVFEAGQNHENLSGVGFFVPADNYQYEVFVSVDDNLSTRKRVVSGTVEFAGYHTISFPQEWIESNSKFAVIVKGTGGTYPIPMEIPMQNASKAKAENGQSFMSSNGINWENVNSIYSNSNVTLKAFTKNILEEPEPEPTVLPIKIKDEVRFKMQFIGAGRYDLIVKGVDGKIVKEILNQRGSEGIQTLTWDGTDYNGNVAKEGEYLVEVIAYKGQSPKKAIVLNFEKKSKIISATAFEDNGVKVRILPEENGQVSIYKVCDGIEIFEGKYNVKANEEQLYTFDDTNIQSINICIE